MSTTEIILDEVHGLEAHAVQAVTAVRADAEERILALEIACQKLAADVGREKTRADGLYAANVRLVADGLQRETALEADRDEARRERNIARANERVSAEMTRAMSRDLRKKHLEVRRVSELFADATGEIGRLQTELDAATAALDAANAQATAKRRFRRRH